jgi:hypothetical protein
MNDWSHIYLNFAVLPALKHIFRSRIASFAQPEKQAGRIEQLRRKIAPFQQARRPAVFATLGRLK